MYAQIYSSSGKEAGTEITKKEGDHTKTDCRGAITVHQGREKKKKITYIGSPDLDSILLYATTWEGYRKRKK